MTKKFVFVFLFLIDVIKGGDIPIIFIHGNKGSGNDDDGWKTWYPSGYPTAMTKILNEEYKGYKFGLTADGEPAWKCNIETNLMPMPDAKRIYNFSYYHPSAYRGVISLSEEKVKVYIYYDITGREKVSAPYMPGYPPSQYHHTEWWPRYVPINGDPQLYGSYNHEYIESWNNGKFAKRLAEFIDKVLAATSAQKVDIVAHSMGGLVARVAIKNYGIASKVRKLIMVGTPNHTFQYSNIEWLIQFFGNYKDWQKSGELLEMGVGWNTKFIDLIIGIIGDWHDFLGYENYIEGMSTIAGKRDREILNIWDPISGEDDGIVKVTQVKLNSAQFNPVIYASHDHGIEGASGELSLTECTYVTEFIKKWMIDDEIIIGAQITNPELPAAPYARDENKDKFSCTYWGESELRTAYNVNDYQKCCLL